MGIILTHVKDNFAWLMIRRNLNNEICVIARSPEKGKPLAFIMPF